jgi:hypothetical protein
MHETSCETLWWAELVWIKGSIIIDDASECAWLGHIFVELSVDLEKQTDLYLRQFKSLSNKFSKHKQNKKHLHVKNNELSSNTTSKVFWNRILVNEFLFEYHFTNVSLTCSKYQKIFFLFYHFYIYSLVYTLFGPPPPLLEAEPFPPSCSILLQRKHKW